MPWTQTDVDNLKAAIAAGRGVRSIQFSDQVVSFNSLREMLDLLSVMQQDVSAAAGTTGRTRYAQTSKGC